MRRGVSLVEILIALAIIAGPALYALDLIRESSRAARIDAERAAGVQLLGDVLEILHAEGPAVSRIMKGGQEAVRDLARKRVAFYPDQAARTLALRLVDKLSVKIDDRSDGVTGLACITVSVDLERTGPVTLSRWLRTHVSAKGTRPRTR